MIAMIAGAACELLIGDPRNSQVQIGPVIDANAKDSLDAHIAKMRRSAIVHFAGEDPFERAAGRILCGAAYF